MRPLVTRFLINTFITAIFLIVAGVAGFCFHKRSLDTKEQLSDLIDDISLQKTLILRIGLLSHRLVIEGRGHELESLQAELKHLALQAQALTEEIKQEVRAAEDLVSSKTFSLLQGPPYNLDENLDIFLKSALQLADSPARELTIDNPALHRIARLGIAGTIVTALDAAMLDIHHRLNEIQDDLEQLHHLELAVLISLILFFILVILLPLIRRMHSDFNDLEKSRKNAEDSRSKALLLAEIGSALSSSLDYEKNLRTLTRLTVPELADYSYIDLLDENGKLVRKASAHIDPEKEYLLEEMFQGIVSLDTFRVLRKAIDAGRSVIVDDIKLEEIKRSTPEPEQEKALYQLGPKSAAVVPLLSHGKRLGIMLFVFSESGRTYSDEDLALIDEIGRRAVFAIDNGRLYTQAQDAIEARDQMNSIVSHDLRNPLSAILTTVTALLNGKVPPDAQKRLLENARTSALRMNALLQDLLDMARLDKGHLRVEPKPTQIAALIRQLWETQQPLAALKDLQLNLANHLAPELTVSIDGDRLEQALTNIVANAIKFTPPGGTVSLQARKEDRWLVISVHDTGPGIPREMHDRIFDRFYQARAGGREGAGLGLAIAKGIVEAHGGNIGVRSALGRGTTIYINLPLTD